MSAIAYYCVLPFLYLVSFLPFRLLYALSDACCFLLYTLAGYRKDVVMQNLRNSFPDKIEPELKIICKDFYHNLCDVFLETLKAITVSRATLLRRCAMTPETIALFEGLAWQGKSVVLVTGHQGNWEWGGCAFSLTIHQPFYVIYHTLSNKHFDGLMYRLRSRFGAIPITMQDTFRKMVEHRAEVNVTAFIADQSPAPDSAYWVDFLHQDTPVFPGAEKLAKRLNYAVVYLQVKRIKRGFYQMLAELITDEPKLLADGEITRLHVQSLEQDIIAQPYTWLWSHRRWKHTRNRPPVTD